MTLSQIRTEALRRVAARAERESRGIDKKMKNNEINGEGDFKPVPSYMARTVTSKGKVLAPRRGKYNKDNNNNKRKKKKSERPVTPNPVPRMLRRQRFNSSQFSSNRKTAVHERRRRERRRRSLSPGKRRLHFFPDQKLDFTKE